jgi:hypothetical protein
MELFGRRSVMIVAVLLSLGAVAAGYVFFLQWHGRSLMQRNDLIELQRLVEKRKWLATRLLAAAYDLQNKEAFELLLKSGATPDGISHERLTLLHSAARNADSFWLEALLRYGANPNYSEVIRGIYPIMEAILGNHPDNVRLLISAGADINVFTYRNESMLTFAWGMRKGEVAMVLLEHGALVNPPCHRYESFVCKFQTRSTERFAVTERDERDEDFLVQIRERFREQNLDLQHATWDESQGDFGVWKIPGFSEKPNENPEEK